MTTEVKLDAVYVPSEDVVARVIEGELIIVPLAAGIGDTDDELFTLNPTGHAIWDRLDGKTSLRAVATALAAEYEADREEIERDVLGLMGELVKRRMVTESPDI